ncbi:hypothetical protein Oscil6304_1984 [Oscillatoria acuminata PCC 6304]|uniref:Uncharacterized protein n=1 Tax=Oscillatoria acuminata PCC 6304 TaxID=56110 RepID=K9TGW5_9CYAN|nr:hypothetical protein Oscil6304_1984 [Oscillatoria acuminata PCC 6304]
MDSASYNDVQHRLLPFTLLDSPQPKRHRIGKTAVETPLPRQQTVGFFCEAILIFGL